MNDHDMLYMTEEIIEYDMIHMIDKMNMTGYDIYEWLRVTDIWLYYDYMNDRNMWLWCGDVIVSDKWTWNELHDY